MCIRDRCVCVCVCVCVRVHLWMFYHQKLQATSLSQLFVSFLESESTPHTQPHPPILPTAATTVPTPTPPGYINPRTDPDRPSLATAPLLKPHPVYTPSHSVSVTGGPRSAPEKPSSIPIPKLDTSHSDSRQVASPHKSQSTEQNKQNASNLFSFTQASRPSSAHSTDSTGTSQVSRSSQSSILRNVLS